MRMAKRFGSRLLVYPTKVFLHQLTCSSSIRTRRVRIEAENQIIIKLGKEHRESMSIGIGLANLRKKFYNTNCIVKLRFSEGRTSIVRPRSA